MIELHRITIKQYYELEDKSEYDFAMKYAHLFTEPKDEYEIGDIMELSFGFIKDFQYELERGISFDKFIDFICELTKKSLRLKLIG